MVILEDTRNKPGKHLNINEYMIRNGIMVRRCALYVGDYIIANDGKVSIDTKQDVMELSMDVYADHKRFRNECLRAQEAGIQLIVLTEEALPDGRLDNWHPPARSGIKPASLRNALITMQKKYGVKFRFCSKWETGELILRYLTGGNNESPNTQANQGEDMGRP